MARAEGVGRLMAALLGAAHGSLSGEGGSVKAELVLF
ncbi:hypothetical protein HNO92_003155 [Chromobacterium alkanivorans]|nr:hypothetical protein [Chromobacterium alkanivorans]MCS3820066.1 hypothetical protein [Chromobacterium alkanivorans]MCS3874823.1 hypothetical protein [Chromobacterium alkanivorans]